MQRVRARRVSWRTVAIATLLSLASTAAATPALASPRECPTKNTRYVASKARPGSIVSITKSPRTARRIVLHRVSRGTIRFRTLDGRVFRCKPPAGGVKPQPPAPTPVPTPVPQPPSPAPTPGSGDKRFHSVSTGRNWDAALRAAVGKGYKMARVDAGSYSFNQGALDTDVGYAADRGSSVLHMFNSGGTFGDYDFTTAQQQQHADLFRTYHDRYGKTPLRADGSPHGSFWVGRPSSQWQYAHDYIEYAQESYHRSGFGCAQSQTWGRVAGNVGRIMKGQATGKYTKLLIMSNGDKGGGGGLSMAACMKQGEPNLKNLVYGQTSHPYNAWNDSGVYRFRVQYRDLPIPIVFTEYGWTTCGCSYYGGETTLEGQAANYERLTREVNASYPYVEGMIAYYVTNLNSGRGAGEDNFGLQYSLGNPKPAWDRFAAAANATGKQGNAGDAATRQWPAP